MWSAFWSKAGVANIRTKIIGIVAFCIIASALAMVWYTYHDVSASLRNELLQRGVAIGTGLAAQSRDLILTDDQFGLYRLVKDTFDSNQDIVYIFVLDTAENILVHTFDKGFPVDVLEKNKLSYNVPYQVITMQAEYNTIQDIAIPVLGGKAGVVRLGISEDTINSAVMENVRNILLLVALILALGLSVAYGLASILTDPISRLAEATRAIGRGDFKWRTPIWARDEIGTLGDAFNEMSKELSRKEEMRVQLLKKVINAQEDERKRIARELHDETGQSLTSLMVGLKYIEEASGNVHVSEKTAELRTLAAQTLSDIHQLSTELRPSLLDDLGLVAAINRYTRDYSIKMNTPIDTHISGLDEHRLLPEVEVAIYRIVQEALTNVAKHAEANNVSVVLRCRDSMMVTLIEDDGKGFDIDSIMSSVDGRRLGLFGMYERAALIGGKITVESQLGDGTTIFLEVPLKLL